MIELEFWEFYLAMIGSGAIGGLAIFGALSIIAAIINRTKKKGESEDDETRDN